MPGELQPLWHYNRRWFVDVLFQCVRETLMELLKDEKYLGAVPGIILSLHTWGRALNLHPHIHCLITGGGLDGEGRWRSSKADYLLPVRVVKALYKGKLLSRLWGALNAGELKLPPDQTDKTMGRILKQINRKSWNVRLKERYDHGRGVMLYLSRYVKGGAISDRRIVAADEKQVIFRYKDHRDGHTRYLRLDPEHFLERVIWHVPEAGQHTVRHCGLYAHQAREKRGICRTQLGQETERAGSTGMEWQNFWERLGKSERGRCSTCGKRLTAGTKLASWRGKQQNSIAVRPRSGFVQQAVGADLVKSGEPPQGQVQNFFPGVRPLN